MNFGILNIGDIVYTPYSDYYYRITQIDNQGVYVDIGDTRANTYLEFDEIRLSPSKDIKTTVEKVEQKAFETQVGGGHYAKLKIQPMQYCLENNLNYAQSNAIKYITRYKDKNGKQDLEKAIHCLQLLMEYEYGNK